MNTNVGLIGKKLGNTQIFTDDGEVRRVTVVETAPNTIVGIRTEEKHGYWALQLAWGKANEKHVNKPQAGFFKKAGIETIPAVVKEFRLPKDIVEKYEVGQQISLGELFEAGMFVDVTGTSKGRGFTGVMKRHGFAGYKATHGAHEYQRHGGSIGMNMTPGRVFKGKKMAGQYGNKRKTVQNLKVVRVMAEENLILVEGGVPGPRNGTVTVRLSVKKGHKRAESI